MIFFLFTSSVLIAILTAYLHGKVKTGKKMYGWFSIGSATLGLIIFPKIARECSSSLSGGVLALLIACGGLADALYSIYKENNH